MNIITTFNTFLKKRFNIGFVKNYPYRSATNFANNLFKHKKEIICAEIGTFEGDHALYMLQKLKNTKKLYLIDPWELYEKYHEQKNSNIILNKAYNKTMSKLKKYTGKIEIIRKYSNTAIKDVPNNLDYVYIDGNHDYKYVINDMILYYEKLKKGGILAGHDISYPGVSKAFCEFVTKNNIKKPMIKNMDWIIIKE